MTQVRETKLPGVGVRYEYTTEEGADVGVIVHHDGRREIISYDVADPDACHSLIAMSEHDTQTLAEILGTSHVTETVAEVRQAIEELTIEWFDIPASSNLVGQSIEDSTKASIVAVLRDGESHPNPAPSFVLEAGDTAVVVGDSVDLVSLRERSALPEEE